MPSSSSRDTASRLRSIRPAGRAPPRRVHRVAVRGSALRSVIAILPLVILLADPASAQTHRDHCSKAAARCASAPAEDAWERISRDLSDFSSDAVRQGGGEPRGVALVDKALQPESREAPTRGGGILASEPRGPGGEPSSARRAARVDQLLPRLQAAGMSWPEACAVAVADAYEVDWLTASRRCVTRRTGSRSYEHFVEVLTDHGAPARDACVAAERYWRGLAVAGAEEACASRAR